jgi:hypothetical protein
MSAVEKRRWAASFAGSAVSTVYAIIASEAASVRSASRRDHAASHSSSDVASSGAAARAS